MSHKIFIMQILFNSLENGQYANENSACCLYEAPRFWSNIGIACPTPSGMPCNKYRKNRIAILPTSPVISDFS